MNYGFGRDLSCDDNLILLLLVCGSASRHMFAFTRLHCTLNEQEFNNVIIYYICLDFIDLLFTYSSTLFSLLFLISNAFIMF